MAEMTKRERLLTAIGHKEPDFVPVSPIIRNHLMQNKGCACWIQKYNASKELDYDPIITVNRSRIMDPFHNHMFNVGGHYYDGRGYYEDLEEGVMIHLSVDRKEDHTLIKRRVETPAGELIDVTRQPLPEKGYGLWPQPHKEEYPVKGREDLDKLLYLLPKKPQLPAMANLKDSIEFVGDDGLVAATVHSPLSYQGGYAYGLEDLMMLYYEEKDFFKDFLQIFHQHCLKMIDMYLEAGVEVIHMGWWQESLGSGWSPSIYQEMFAPLLREQVERIRSSGGISWFYDDGKMKKLLPLLREIKPDIVSTLTPPPMGDVELREAKEMIGDVICLRGNIDQVHVMEKGTVELIREKVREAIVAAAKGGGFILSNADPFYDTKEENVRAFCEAAREFGNYKHLGESR